MLAAELGQVAHPVTHGQGHRFRVVDDDPVALGGIVAQRVADEGVHLAEVVGAVRRAGEHHRQRDILVGRMQQHPQQIEDFLGGADAAGEHDDAVGHAQKRLQALLDVRHDHQLVDDRVGRFGGDDARLGNTQVAALAAALLGVRHMGAFHRPLHGAGPAAGADVQLAQPQLVADALGVVVLFPGNRMPAPAHHQIRQLASVQHPGVTQDVEHRVGNAGAVVQVEAAAVLDLVGHVDDVPQHRRQVLADTANHAPVHERSGRGVIQLEHHAAVFLDHLDVEILVGLQHLAAVVGGGAGVQHRQGAAAQQLVQTLGGGVAQALHFLLAENFQAALGGDDGRYRSGH